MSINSSRRRFLNTTLATAAVAATIARPRATAARKGPAFLTGPPNSIGFALHGGAGTLERGQMSAEREKAYRDALTEALQAGQAILLKGGPSLDAVVAAIKILEDSPLFNAGRGAVFTSAGTNELDSSIMDGRTLKAGAAASLKHIKNPIALARLVMDRSPHVMMVGEGAEAFARELGGIEFVEQKYFYTEERWRALQKIKEGEKNKRPEKTGARRAPDRDRFGTVGAVALDRAGDLAAGTSTGGMTNKRFGRVGDSPIIGAGTYANNRTCAVSATGDGEYFIRTAAAYDISAQMEHKNTALEEAAQTVIGKVGALGGGGGVIAIDRAGRIAMPFNTSGMYRGLIDADGRPVTRIYKDA